jgi:phage portal protein BeeE
MNLVSLLSRRSSPAVARKGGVGYGGYGNNFPLGSAFTDRWKKDRQPTPLELIRELVGIAYVCVDLNSSCVANTKLELFVRTKRGERKTRWPTRSLTRSKKEWLGDCKSTTAMMTSGEVEQVLEHPILRILDINDQGLSVDDSDYSDTRPALSGFQLMRITQMYLESIGRAYWLVEFDGLGCPEKVWLLRSHYVKEMFSPDGSGRIDYYEYGGPAGVRYDPRQILRFLTPDPNNPYLGGYAPLMAAIEKLRIYRGQDANIGAILENSARPEAIWSPSANGDTGGMLGPAEARRMEVAINQKYREAGRGGIMVQPYPGTLQPISWKPGDIIDLERSKLLKGDIMAIFGVPDAMYERNQTTVAGAKTSDYAHAKYAVMPRLTNFLSTLRSLLRMYDPDGRMFFGYMSPLPPDSIYELERTRLGVTSGAIEVDEMRASMDLEPYGSAAGKLRYVNTQLSAVDRDGHVFLPSTPPSLLPPELVPDDSALPKPKPEPEKSIRSRLRKAGYADDEIVALIAKQPETQTPSEL